jgi:hypothetical protein
MWSTIAAYREPWEAHLLRGRLEAEGIPAIVVHEHHAGVNWPFSTGLGGAKVQVPGELWREAGQIECLCCQGEFRTLLQSEAGDLADVKCPHCGSEEYRKRRPFLRAVFAVSLSFCTGSVFPPLGWIHRCNGCGREYWPPRCRCDPRIGLAIMLETVALMLALFILTFCINSILSCKPVAEPCLLQAFSQVVPPP